MITLVTEKVCPVCSMVKNILKIKKIDHKLVEFDSDEGKALLEKFNVKSLPLYVDDVEGLSFTGQEVIKYLKSK